MQLRGGATFDSKHGEAMSDDIPFDKRFDLVPGQVEEVMPGVRRLMADNPGPFTFKGTVSYIVGRGEVAVIDPGPLIDAHVGALLEAVRGERVTHIFVTHTHRDHSPAAAPLKAATAGQVIDECDLDLLRHDFPFDRRWILKKRKQPPAEKIKYRIR